MSEETKNEVKWAREGEVIKVESAESKTQVLVDWLVERRLSRKYEKPMWRLPAVLSVLVWTFLDTNSRLSVAGCNQWALHHLLPRLWMGVDQVRFLQSATGTLPNTRLLVHLCVATHLPRRIVFDHYTEGAMRLFIHALASTHVSRSPVRCFELVWCDIPVRLLDEALAPAHELEVTGDEFGVTMLLGATRFLSELKVLTTERTATAVFATRNPRCLAGLTHWSMIMPDWGVLRYTPPVTLPRRLSIRCTETDVELLAMLESLPSDHLESLHVTLTTGSVFSSYLEQQIVRAGSRLTDLKVDTSNYQRPPLASAFVARLWRDCPRLERLALDGFGAPDDWGRLFQSMAPFRERVRFLNIDNDQRSACDFETVASFVRSCPRLGGYVDTILERMEIAIDGKQLPELLDFVHKDPRVRLSEFGSQTAPRVLVLKLAKEADWKAMATFLTDMHPAMAPPELFLASSHGPDDAFFQTTCVACDHLHLDAPVTMDSKLLSGFIERSRGVVWLELQQAPGSVALLDLAALIPVLPVRFELFITDRTFDVTSKDMIRWIKAMQANASKTVTVKLTVRNAKFGRKVVSDAVGGLVIEHESLYDLFSQDKPGLRVSAFRRHVVLFNNGKGKGKGDCIP